MIIGYVLRFGIASINYGKYVGSGAQPCSIDKAIPFIMKRIVMKTRREFFPNCEVVKAWMEREDGELIAVSEYHGS